MASLETLPNELLHQIVGCVRNKSDIASLRQTNRRLNQLATPVYFKTVPLYPQWTPSYDDDPPWPNNVDYDAQLFKNVLENNDLKRLVKRVDIYTCNPDCNHHPHWANGKGAREDHYYEQSMPEYNFKTTWWNCFYHMAPKLENLRGVSLIFDRWGGAHDYSYDWDDEDLLQTRHDRTVWLHKILRLLGTRIKELSLRNFQDELMAEDLLGRVPQDRTRNILYRKVVGVGHREFAKREMFKSESIEEEDIFELRERVVRNLESLRMSITHEQVRGESDSHLKGGSCHITWEHFPARWLVPAQNLKRLVLYSDLPLGWFPKLDLRNVHLQNLQSLTLGQFVFFHEHQVDWIISHQSTLSELYLDHCSILYQVGSGCRDTDGSFLDDEGYVKCDPYTNDFPRSYSENNPVFVSYSLRWHEIFNRFSLELPKLRTFRFGTSEGWNFDPEHENRYDDVGGMPIMPWESEKDMKNEVLDRRYLHYNDWDDDYGVLWKDYDKESVDFSHEKFAQAGMQGPPQCDEEDRTALWNLLRKIEI